MEAIKNKLQIKKFTAEKIETNWYKELGKEMTAYFGKNCYWLPYRYPRHKLHEKFTEIQRMKKSDFKYFIGMLTK